MFTGMPDFNQSVEMMKNMWSNAAKGSTDGTNPTFGFPGMSTQNPFGIPVVDVEELEKRIKDLKSVEAWLTLNLNVLQTTIQGLEVQKATLSTLHGIAETMRSASAPSQEGDAPKKTPSAADFAGSSGKLAQELMQQMSKSMTDMMSAFPTGTSTAAKTPKKPAAKKAAKKTTPAKTSRSRSNRGRG